MNNIKGSKLSAWDKSVIMMSVVKKSHRLSLVKHQDHMSVKDDRQLCYVWDCCRKILKRCKEVLAISLSLSLSLSLPSPPRPVGYQPTVVTELS